MADEEKMAAMDTLEASPVSPEAPASETVAPAAEVGSGDLKPSASPRLRVKPAPEAAPGDVAAEQADDGTDDDALGAPAAGGQWKLAGLFGGAKAAEDGDELDESANWAAVQGSRPRRPSSGIRIVNRVLVAAIVLILFLGVIDLFATVRQPPGDLVLSGPPAAAGIPENATGEPELSGGLPALALLLDSFSKRPIVRNLEQGAAGGTTVEVVPTRQKVPDWKVYAQNLDLIGLSGTADGEKEAIVADRKANRTYFVKLEQDMVAGDNQFKLIRIASDHVVFDKDGEEVVVK